MALVSETFPVTMANVPLIHYSLFLVFPTYNVPMLRRAFLALISRQSSTAAGDALRPAAFSPIGMLDGLSSTTPRPSGRKLHWPQHFAALATNIGEKCGLALVSLLITTTVNATTVHIILDASATMRRPLIDRKERMTMASDLVTTLFSLVPPDADVTYGIRVFGSSHPITSVDACSDTVLLHPISHLEDRSSLDLLQTIRSGGGAPLALALREAGNDLEGTTGPQILIVITDGDDSCGGDLEGPAAALKERFPLLRLHFIGISVPGETKKRLSAIAPTSIAGDSKSMVNALITAIGEDVPLDKSRHPVTIDLMPTDLLGRYEKAELRSTVFASTEALEIRDGTVTGVVTGGVYTLRLSGQLTDLEISPIILPGGQNNTLVITLPNFHEAALEVADARFLAGDDVEVAYQNAPEGSWLTLVSKDSTANTIDARVPIAGKSGTIDVHIPPLQKVYEIRMHVPLGEGLSAIVTRASLIALRPETWLEIPEGLVPVEVEAPFLRGVAKNDVEISFIDTLETNQGIEVMWKGPGAPGDFLSFVPAGAPAETVLNAKHVRESSVIDMWAPNDACEYELRYISPGTAAIVDLLKIRVIEPEAVLFASETAIIGSEVEIRWIGPDDFNDYITIVDPETLDGEYTIWKTTDKGNPLFIRAPMLPGAYEIRYMSGHQERVLDRIPIEITGIEIELHGPDTVNAGQRFLVHWVGPNRNGDFIVVAPQGSKPRRHLDFTFTSLGNPASLSAPFRSGDFEIRYISGSDNSILGSVPLIVPSAK